MIKRRTNVEIIALGFAIVILVGTFLLLLPVSSDHTDFLDALFTATSATCVTGLVVYDTATQQLLMNPVLSLHSIMNPIFISNYIYCIFYYYYRYSLTSFSVSCPLFALLVDLKHISTCRGEISHSGIQ